jgi:hypothetical protein
MNREKKRPYMSMEAKSTRERYSRVAAIAIMIIAGIWNIYVTRGVRKLGLVEKQERTRFHGSGISNRIQLGS